MRATILALVVASVVCCAALASVVCCAAGFASSGTEAQQLQLCVDRWNATNMRWGRPNTVAIVKSAPCRITLAYAPGDGSIDRKNHFACQVNRFGAYQCDSHAQGPGYDPGGWNSTLRAYKLRLVQPPPVRLRFTPQPWMTRYELLNGYIIPYRPNGQLRAGIRTHGNVTGACIPPSGAFNYKTTQRCFGDDDYIRDPCYSPSGTVSIGSTVLCPDAPGSTLFNRFRVNGTV